MNPNEKTAIIIGAGPAGLTAAYELVKRTSFKPIIFEATPDIGGISKTVNYKGNRIDIGGHRFFSKSDRVMKWWQEIMPIQTASADETGNDLVMLIRNRLSRIFYLRNFFDYPISLNVNTFKNLGIKRTVKIGFSYIKASLAPIKKEVSLEDFLINRFGNELYKTFFRDYTEKVWGIECNKIPAEWGAQRIKGVSISKAVIHALKKSFSKNTSISQKNLETSLIEQFLYPKLGPGQLWEKVANLIESKGGKIKLNHNVVGIKHENNKIISVKVMDSTTGKTSEHKADIFLSSMPLKDLINSMENKVPDNVVKTATALPYRDFITVGLLLKKLIVKDSKSGNMLISDNWIYIQEADVKLGRIQIFNNWSPFMVKDKENVWIGLEYFCNQGDDLWSKSDDEMSDFATKELVKIGFINPSDLIDKVVIRMPKTYPAYFGAYNNLHVVKDFLNTLDNFYPVGRNGMHRYNNQDHSMLTAMLTVDHLCGEFVSKKEIWEVNTEQEYHEKK
ncbi:MAG: hypothetical protein COS89_00380 [Deltaproteobacteria bacterium CG07_land_8_20_14_0_80_38_7]|nr:MAG: hypothetical protein COS89_00380 [Deltaproteobacteria bacterium CG07_land_8_20_14_0_80_38_7]